MEFIIKVSKFSLLHGYLIILLAAIPTTSPAQAIIDTSSPGEHLVEPTIVETQSTVEPDCHTYTGCGAIFIKKYPVYHYKKIKRPCVYYRCRPCC